MEKSKRQINKIQPPMSINSNKVSPIITLNIPKLRPTPQYFHDRGQNSLVTILQNTCSLQPKKIQHQNYQQSQLSKSNTKTYQFDENKDSIQQFQEACKLQCGFSTLLIQKLSLIVTKYFKFKEEISLRNQQIELLIQYNKDLIQILLQFENQQNKILNKLKTMEEFNIKIMKQLCILKNREFHVPYIKPQESIFSKFNLKDLTYQKKKQPLVCQDQNYKQKLQKVFKNYFLTENESMKKVIEDYQNRSNTILENQKIKQQQNQEIQQILSSIKKYNEKINQVTYQNMFDIFQLKNNIKDKIKCIRCINENNEVLNNNEQINEKKFVQQIIQIHANLNNMNQNEILTHLKNEKQVKNTLKKLKLKQQNKFLSQFQLAQNNNIELKKDISTYKQKNAALQQQLTRLKMQIQVKMMKNKAGRNMSNQNNISFDQSFADDIKITKRMLRQTIKNLQGQMRILKQEKDKLSQAIKQKQQIEQQRKQKIKKITSKVAQLNINVQVDSDQIKLFENVIQKYISNNNSNKLMQIACPFSPMTPISPVQLQDQHSLHPMQNPHFYATNSEKLQQIQKQAEQIKHFKQDAERYQEQIQIIAKKNQSLNLHIQQIEKQKNKYLQIIQNKENAYIEALKQEEKYKLLCQQFSQKVKQIQTELAAMQESVVNHENQYKAEINNKNQKIKSIIKENEILMSEVKKFATKNQQLFIQNESAEKLSGRIMRAVETLGKEDMSAQKFLRVMDKMFAKLKTYVQDYKKQTKKQTSILHDPKHNNSFQLSLSGEQNSGNSGINIPISKVGLENLKFLKQKKQKKTNEIGINVNIPIQIKNKNDKNQLIESLSFQIKACKKFIIVQIYNLSINQFPHHERPKRKSKKTAEKSRQFFNFQQQLEGYKKAQINILESIQLRNKGLVQSIEVKNNIKRNNSNESKKKQQLSLFSSQQKNKKQNDYSQNRNSLSFSKDNLVVSRQFIKSRDHIQSLKQLQDNVKANQSSFKIKVSPPKNQNMQTWNLKESSKIFRLNILGPIFENQRKQQRSIINSSRPPQMDDLSLLSLQKQVPSKRQQLHGRELYSQMDVSALNAGVQAKYVQKMLAKYERLSNEEDVLDFWELYQKYKQAMKCLQKSQQVVRLHQIRYQKFIQKLIKFKQLDNNYNLQLQLYFLIKKVNEQKQLLDKQQIDFQSSCMKQIKKTEKTIIKQLKLLKLQQKKGQKLSK